MTRRRYASNFEAKIADYLRSKNIKFKYEYADIRYTRIHKYVPDFFLKFFILEVKGRFTSADRTKHRLIKEQHPDLDIRILFMRDNRLYKGSDTLYTEWCKKYKIKCAVSKIPTEWLKECK